MSDQRADLELLDNDALEQSAVVANCAMNRERQLSGVNLKDEAQVHTLEADPNVEMKGNFLLSPPEA